MLLCDVAKALKPLRFELHSKIDVFYDQLGSSFIGCPLKDFY